MDEGPVLRIEDRRAGDRDAEDVAGNERGRGGCRIRPILLHLGETPGLEEERELHRRRRRPRAALAEADEPQGSRLRGTELQKTLVDNGLGRYGAGVGA